jgi:hypothetical protein
LYAFLPSPMRATFLAPLFILDLITLIIYVKHTSYETLNYAVFFSFPQLPPSWVQRFSSAPYFHTPSICLIKSSRAISRVRCTLYTDVSMSISHLPGLC